MYYGLENGLFQRRGVELELKYYYGGPELCQAMAQGAIGVGDLGLPPFLKAHSLGLPAKIVGGTIMQQLDHYLAARPEIASLTELRGKRIGVLSLGSCDDYFIRRMLTAAGVDLGETTLVCQGAALGGKDDCFADGEIDAGFVVEPKLSLGECAERLRILARVGDYFPRYQWGVMVAREDYLTSKLDLVRSVLAAYRQACRAIVQSPEDSIALGARVFGVTEEVFGRALMRNLAHWNLDASLDLEGLKNAMVVQKELGAIATEPAVEDIVQQPLP